MKTRRMGRDGPVLSCIGIGAMSFAGFYGATTQEDSFAVLDAARDAGITHIDTANIYGMGKSEQVIGAYLAARPGAREAFHIATKASITADAAGNRRIDNSAAHLEAELDKSLQRLGTDHVDLFYIHRREVARPIEEVAETLARLVASGKCSAVGLSEVAPWTLRRAHAVTPIAAVQSEYSLSTRAPDLGLVQACAELGTTLVAFSPVGRSLLTDRPVGRDGVASNPFFKVNPRFLGPEFAANLAATDRFRTLAAEMGTSAAALAMAWVLSRGEHVLPIPGTRTVAHLQELIAGAALELDEAALTRIEAVLPVGWAHGDRYGDSQWIGVERYS
ncbi:MAG: aldo/keto reductase [Roseivivax sp.]|nr:aldo/keto reductase [Roseivivax sp.]